MEEKFQEEFSCSLHISAALNLAKNHQLPLESGLDGNRIRSERTGKEKTSPSGNAAAAFQLLFIGVAHYEKMSFP